MNEVQKILGRVSLFYWLVFVLGMLIIGKIVSLQFFSPDLKAEGEQRAVRVEEIEANRGNILTYDGRVLATSLPYYEIRMDFAVPGLPDSIFNREVGSLAQSLAGLFKDKSANAYKSELVSARNSKNKNRYKKIGPRRISYLELQEAKEFPIFVRGRNKGGFMVIERNERSYPYQGLAYRTVGWRNTQGVSVGIEGSFDEYLRGTPGLHMVQRMGAGEWMPISGEEQMIAEDGYDIVTTLDVDIQDAAENALREQLKKDKIFEAGTAIVMEVSTGEIRAIANMKRNPNGTYSEAFNYAIAQVSDPGSTFKLATLIALLEDGYTNLNTVVETGNGYWTYLGKTYTEASQGYGTLTLKQAFEKSSNVAFAKLSVEHYKGKEKKFIQHFQDLGLDARLGLQIEGEGMPYISHPDKPTWSKLSVPQISMGYEMSLAPIHTLTLYNAVANNGKMVKPKFATEVRKHGQTVKTFPTETIKNSICSSSTLKQVKEALEGVVTNGTAKELNSGPYRIAGKTGTAQIPFESVYHDNQGVRKTRMIYKDREGNRKHQASFAGYFPADNPRYSAIVVLYSAQTKDNFYGGKWAAPVFKEIADKVYATNPSWHEDIKEQTMFAELPKVKGGKGNEVSSVLTLLNIPADKVNGNDWVKVAAKDGKLVARTTELKTTVPSVVNMGLKEALYILENMGLNVYYSGKGTVKSQSIEAGAAITKGQSIYLTLEV